MLLLRLGLLGVGLPGLECARVGWVSPEHPAPEEVHCPDDDDELDGALDKAGLRAAPTANPTEKRAMIGAYNQLANKKRRV